MKHRAVLPLLLSFALLLPLGCDKADPVAPTGSTMTLSASPAQISSANGTSTITAVVLRANGNPVNPGTQVRFSTNLGTIDASAETNSSGVATAILRGDGRVGTAKVTATTGNVATAPTVDVAVGRAAKTLTLQANPTNLASSGGRVRLIAVVRDTSGQPLSDATVTFQTELGRLDSRGSVLRTDANGEVRDTLDVSASDIEITESTGFTVTARATNAEGGFVEGTFRITVQSLKPQADFTAQPITGGHKIQFTNTSKGEEPLAFVWDFGDGTVDPDEQALRNPVHDYGTSGTFTVTLTATNSKGSDVVTKQVTVP